MSHKYKNLEPEQMEALLSSFLIDSWSYSKVSTFARNQLAFEMQYVYGIYGRSGASAMAGKGYHKALEVYFAQLMDGGVLMPVVEMENVAYEHIGSIPANQWKLGKKTPTMEKAVEEALKIATKLIRNFYGEREDYESDIAEVLAVEMRFDEWLTVNGVDIPLPCHGVLDRVVRTKRNTIAIIDDKSKSTYTDEKAQELVIGPQAITYALGYEAKTGRTVDEVWFMENKHSRNEDGTVQIHMIKKELDINTRRLYEALLYTNLRQLISAVNDPNYVYTVNLMDPMMDMAEMADFFYRTLIAEVDDFNVDPAKKQLVAKRLKKIRDSNVKMIPPSVIKSFKEKAATFIQYDLSVTNMKPNEKIEHVLRTFGIQSRVAHTFEGYSSNTYLIEVGAGTKIDSIQKYRLDIANGMDVANVRIGKQLKVHQGKSYLSLDISKKNDKILRFEPTDRDGWKIPLGKDNLGNIVHWDLLNPSTPHAMICGSTGSGKSIEVFNILEHVLAAGPEHVVIIDPKDEFAQYADNNVDVFKEIWDIETVLERLVGRMETRIRKKETGIVFVIFEEFADALANARSGRSLAEGERTLAENFRILLQKGRSCGLRFLAVTQRASAKIINGDTKVNIPVQICFRVNKAVDSTVILDEAGAEQLSGAGDGLIRSPEYGDTVRFQSYYKPQNAHA